MSGFIGPIFLAPRGATGNNTHAGVGLAPYANKVCAVLVIEAIGAGPTVTAKIQGTLDTSDINDASANWFDLPFLTDTNDTVGATITKVAVGAFPMWLSQSHSRFVRRVRAVTSANTNVTYRLELHQQSTN